MPKAKTHKGMAKRFKVSKKGKLFGDKGHYKMRKRTGKQTRHDRKGVQIEGRMRLRVLKALKK
ncbi:MAG TPA: 50S ribosomal protein L35 [Candidatus Bipolaricaulota bacterium]